MRSLALNGEQTRSDLSRSCGIRKSSVGPIVEELLQANVLVEQKPGQIKTQVGYSNGPWWVESFALVPGRLHRARIGLDGSIFEEEVQALDEKVDPEEVVSRIEEYIDAISDRRHLLGIALSLPGRVDSQQGVCLQSVLLRGWNGVRLKEAIESRTGCTVVIENSVRAALFATQWFERLDVGAPIQFGLEISDGIGGALLVNGNLLYGQHYSSSEIGHIPVGDEGRLCGCGQKDCLETYASLRAMGYEIEQVMPELKGLYTAKTLLDAVRDEKMILQIIERLTGYIQKALSIVLKTIDPSSIILLNQNNQFYDLIVPVLNKNMNLGETKLEVSSLGEKAGIMGAAGKCIEDWIGKQGWKI